MNHQSDYGYSTGAISMRCTACGSMEWACCDGNGKRLSFHEWGKWVDLKIAEIEGSPCNKIEAPYAEMYQEGLSVMAAVERALA